MIRCVNVSFQYLYDLYYRVNHACCESDMYCIDFLDWIKAGVAFNPWAHKDPTRRVEYFGKLYLDLTRRFYEVPLGDLQVAICRYYEDLYKLYQDHLRAQFSLKGKMNDSNTIEPDLLLLVPSFKKLPELYDIITVKEVVLGEYECKYARDFNRDMATAYVEENSLLYRNMAMMYDYGIRRQGNGIILEVT